MTRISTSVAVLILIVTLMAPPLALAQTTPDTVATSTLLDSGTTPATRQRIRGYRQSSAVQQQINALGSEPVASLPMPILFGVSPSNISPNFGDARTNHPHQGEDLMAPNGTPIISPTNAVVLRLETGATEGNGLYTSNPGGETFVYYHLDRYAEGIAAGQTLAPGSLIGYVGNTGDAALTAAHLHFEIHNSAGVPIDPFPRLTSEFTPADKMTFLTKIFTQASDINALATFLVKNFRATFLVALAANISVPLPIITAMAATPASAAVPRGATLPLGDLDVGSKGAAVVTLQKYLILAESGTASLRLASAGATGSFGPITKAALVEFQIDSGITPASGYYGSATRAFVLAHPLGTAAAPVAATPSSVTGTLSRDLQLGMSGEDVRALQQILNANGFTVAATGSGSAGNETTYFGPATKAAVIKFQISKGITPAVGYVGPITRAALAPL